MSKSFSFFLGLRYLKPKRTFLSIITVISVTGVTLGIMVLILVISVMTGFERELQRKVLGFDPHIVISTGGIMEEWRSVLDTLQKDSSITGAAPFVQGPVLVEHGGRRLAPKIRAVDPEMENSVTSVGDFIIDGKYDLDGDKTILGSELAAILNARVGDTVTVYSPGNLSQILDEIDKIEADKKDEQSLESLRAMVLPMELEVTGIFESGRYIYDSEFLIVPLHIGQEIYDLQDMIHGIATRIEDPYHAAEVKEKLLTEIQQPVIVATWMDMNKQLFDAIRMERNLMFFLLMFIVIVAAFSIMNTLITVTVQKTREIGIMKALGARSGQIIGVFVAQGIIVGIIGTLTGLTLGITLVQFRNEVSNWLATTLGIEVFPAAIYQFTEIPAEIVPSDVAIICITSFCICSIAAFLPAWFAARMDPVKALRYE
ncbi:MAG: FtsX-like permease family protein [Chthoniobacterales bacterium]